MTQHPSPPRKIGILGGTFNPIHNGHLAMAEAVRKAHGLQTVLFVPAARPPHKDRELAPVEDRVEMVRLAISGHEGFRGQRRRGRETRGQLHGGHPRKAQGPLPRRGAFLHHR